MEESWIFPITILPAVGLIIMSTTNLSNALSSEINNFLHEDKLSFENLIRRKINQLKILSLSLLFQYISSACFAVAGLIEGLNKTGQFMVPNVTIILLYLGVIGVVCSLVLLTIFAFRAVNIKQHQFDKQLKGKS